MNEEKREYTGIFVSLGMLSVTCLLISNLIAGKTWAVYGNIVVPAAVILFPVTYIMADVFTEVYGFDKMRLVIWGGFFCNLIAVLTYIIVIDLPYPASFLNQDAFAVVFGMTPRVLGASFVGYLFGEFSNSIVMSKLKIITKGEKLWMRTIGSTVDEFCIITEGKAEETQQCIDKLAALTAEWEGQYIRGISISCGMATNAQSADLDAIIQKADSIMYEHKRAYYQTHGRK